MNSWIITIFRFFLGWVDRTSKQDNTDLDIINIQETLSDYYNLSIEDFDEKKIIIFNRKKFEFFPHNYHPFTYIRKGKIEIFKERTDYSIYAPSIILIGLPVFTFIGLMFQLNIFAAIIFSPLMPAIFRNFVDDKFAKILGI
ncbi:hypothetical protein [Parasphingopyxis sp.]|uniref:hypothetical protein n=1 Tax=Parasphingopyxis sp. TaxID=1920299 RepID=UPI00260EA943|nr:hypothetical protein [Parasphingopyxis sp.]